MVTLTTWRRALICTTIPEDSNPSLAPDKVTTTPLQLQPPHHHHNNLIHSPSKFITFFSSSSSSASSSSPPSLPRDSTSTNNTDTLSTHGTQHNQLDHATSVVSDAPIPNLPLRCYNDDEPLMSPVLESDEETLIDNNNNMAAITVSSNSREFVVSVSSFTHFDDTRVALLSMKAPLGSLRACMDLVTVLDVGGDMTSRKLNAMKKAMWLLISSLSSNDRLSIIAFSSGSKRLLPLRRMTPSGKRTARRITDALNLGQGSRVNDALKKAIKVLHDRKENNQSSTIILMNGQDHGIQNNHNRSRFRHVSSTRVSDIPIHTLRVTEELEENMFVKVIKRLLNVVVLDFRFKLELSSSSSSGSTLVEIGSVYSFLEGPTLLNPDVAKLGDFYSKEERQILVEIKTPTMASSSYSDDVILTVRSSYVEPSAKHVMNTCENTVSIGSTSDEDDQRLRSVYVMTKAVVESRRLVTASSDFNGAERVLYNAREVLCKLNCSNEFRRRVEMELAEVILRHREKRKRVKENVDGRWRVVDDAPPVSAWKVAERLAKLAVMRTSLNRVGDLHGFEDARF